jgi:putative transposase
MHETVSRESSLLIAPIALADRHRAADCVRGPLYLCAVKDVCTNRIVGYSVNQRMTSQLAVDALANAWLLRRPVGTTVHSDRSDQFRSDAYVRSLREHGLYGSLGRVGVCADNAAMESFFSVLQTTSSTVDAGRPMINSGWRSPSGSRGPTTADTGKTASVRLTPIDFEALLQAAHAA